MSNYKNNYGLSFNNNNKKVNKQSIFGPVESSSEEEVQDIRTNVNKTLQKHYQFNQLKVII